MRQKRSCANSTCTYTSPAAERKERKQSVGPAAVRLSLKRQELGCLQCLQRMAHCQARSTIGCPRRLRFRRWQRYRSALWLGVVFALPPADGLDWPWVSFVPQQVSCQCPCEVPVHFPQAVFRVEFQAVLPCFESLHCLQRMASGEILRGSS